MYFQHFCMSIKSNYKKRCTFSSPQVRKKFEPTLDLNSRNRRPYKNLSQKRP